MMVIRPVTAGDLPGLMDLARSAGVGLTSLPVNEDRLAARIARSERSFSGEAELAERGYVFVLEDTDTGRVGGICALEAAVGLKEPWYNYRVGNIVHASEELGVYTRHWWWPRCAACPTLTANRRSGKRWAGISSLSSLPKPIT